MFRILSANTIMQLEEEASKYDITHLGSLTISNGHFFMSILGEPKKEKPAIKEPAIPKPRAKRGKINV